MSVLEITSSITRRTLRNKSKKRLQELLSQFQWEVRELQRRIDERDLLIGKLDKEDLIEIVIARHRDVVRLQQQIENGQIHARS